MGSVQASPFGSRQDAHLQEKGHSWKVFTPKGLLAPSHPFDVIHGWAWSWGNGHAIHGPTSACVLGAAVGGLH